MPDVREGGRDRRDEGREEWREDVADLAGQG